MADETYGPQKMLKAPKKTKLGGVTPRIIKTKPEVTVEELRKFNLDLVKGRFKSTEIVDFGRINPPKNFLNETIAQYPTEAQPLAIVELEGKKRVMYNGSSIKLGDGSEVYCAGVMPGYTLSASVAMFEITKPGSDERTVTLLSLGQKLAVGSTSLKLNDLTEAQSQDRLPTAMFEVLNKSGNVIGGFRLKPGEVYESATLGAEPVKISLGPVYQGYTLNEKSADLVINAGSKTFSGNLSIGQATPPGQGDLSVRLADLESASTHKQAYLKIERTDGTYHAFVGEGEEGATVAIKPGTSVAQIGDSIPVSVAAIAAGYTLTTKGVGGINVDGHKIYKLDIGESAKLTDGSTVTLMDVSISK